MNETIIQLQEMLSHQSEDMAHMSREMYLQQKELAALRDAVVKLEARVKTLVGGDSGIRAIEDETPPPHY